MKVCLCFDVSDRLIRERARAGVSIEEVLAETKAGGGCGQCLLAIRRIHAGEAVAAQPCARAGRDQRAA
jgi:bacterioferritin-associated ferredoxin